MIVALTQGADVLTVRDQTGERSGRATASNPLSSRRAVPRVRGRWGLLSIFLLAAASLGLCGFSYMPLEEAGGSAGSLATWALLRQPSRVSSVTSRHPQMAFIPTTRRAAGRTLTFDGYLQPLGPGSLFTHFLLRRDPLCEGCGGTQSGTAIEVFLESPIRYVGRRITVRGQFHLRPNDPQAIYFRLDHGQADVAPEPTSGWRPAAHRPRQTVVASAPSLQDRGGPR
jgi:hypothetical protein